MGAVVGSAVPVAVGSGVSVGSAVGSGVVVGRGVWLGSAVNTAPLTATSAVGCGLLVGSAAACPAGGVGPPSVGVALGSANCVGAPARPGSERLPPDVKTRYPTTHRITMASAVSTEASTL